MQLAAMVHLVERVPDVQVAVGVGGAVVQREHLLHPRTAPAGHATAAVAALLQSSALVAAAGIITQQGRMLNDALQGL